MLPHSHRRAASGRGSSAGGAPPTPLFLAEEDVAALQLEPVKAYYSTVSTALYATLGGTALGADWAPSFLDVSQNQGLVNLRTTPALASAPGAAGVGGEGPGLHCPGRRHPPHAQVGTAELV